MASRVELPEDEAKFGDFEAELKKLQGAVSRLEGSDLTLEEAFEELDLGSASYKSCRRILEHAREKFEILVNGMSDSAVGWETFEDDQDHRDHDVGDEEH